MFVQRNVLYFVLCVTIEFVGVSVTHNLSGNISIRPNTQRLTSLVHFNSCRTLKGDPGHCKPPIFCSKNVRLSELSVCRVSGKTAYICCPGEENGHKPFSNLDNSRLSEINTETPKGHHVHRLFVPGDTSANNPTSKSVFDSFYPKVQRGYSIPLRSSFQGMQFHGSSVIQSYMGINAAHSSGSAQLPSSHFQGSVRGPSLVKLPSFPFNMSQRPSNFFPARELIMHHISQSDKKINPNQAIPQLAHIHSAVTENYRDIHQDRVIETGSAQLPISHFQGPIRRPSLVHLPSFPFDMSQRPSSLFPARETITHHILPSDQMITPNQGIPSLIHTHSAVTENYRDVHQDGSINTAGCGLRRDAQREIAIMPLILGGNKAEENRWPWMISIRKRNNNGKEEYLCGGSLITRKHVLTAAHCFDSKDRDVSQYTVVLGSNLRNPESSQQSIRTCITDIRIPEDYVDTVHYSDIAVLTLDQDVVFGDIVTTVCLPTEKESALEREHQTVTATGWGKTSFDGATSDTLQEAKMQIVSQRLCRSSYRRVNRNRLPGGISNTMICAGVPDGGIDACEGDSGGPLVMEVEGRWFQVGIVSFGYRCGLKDFPGVYTRVSSFMPWLQSVVNGDQQ